MICTIARIECAIKSNRRGDLVVQRARVRVDHDRVSVAVHHLVAHLLHLLFRVLQNLIALSIFTHGKNLSTLESDQRGEVLGVEARLVEAETTIHRVGGQLQRQLRDVVLRVDI